MAATANPEVAPLVSVLARQEAIYQQLLEVASDERQAIVAGNLTDLKAALQRKQDILETDQLAGALRAQARLRGGDDDAGLDHRLQRTE